MISLNTKQKAFMGQTENCIQSVQWNHSNRYCGKVCNRVISNREKPTILCLPSRPGSDLWPSTTTDNCIP